jgi:hemerythrin-like domain-containing protein
MVTQLPSTGSPTCDTSDMVMIHGLFRLIFGDAPALVAAVPDGNAERVAIIGEHVLSLSDNLHNHHHGEDMMLWDQLEARNPACAAHVDQMRAHHAAMGVELQKLNDGVAEWKSDPSAKKRDAVKNTLVAINALLDEHLGAEEKKILPVASMTFSQQEWNKLGEHGRASVAKDFRFIQLGFILESMAEPERAAWAKSNLPAPIRALYALIGKRQYEKYRAAVYG